jgi:DNA uptake protein ComE-like DNA-binding protein
MVPHPVDGSRTVRRFSLREKSSFRGTKSDNRAPFRGAKGDNQNRRAVVLVIVLVVVVVLSLAAYTFTNLMQAHRRSAIVAGKQIQARLLVDSGVDAVKLYLMSDEAARNDMGGHFDNPYYFQMGTVIPGLDAIDRGSYTVLAPLLDDVSGEVGVRYGLEDESNRLNLNMLLVADKTMSGAGRTLLMALPNMTEDTADAILDWIDPDYDPREYGAEDEFYSTLVPSYLPRNAVPATVEELLLVRGVTPDMLFGFDVNRNGMQDVNEMNGMGAGGLPSSGAAAASATTSAASATMTTDPTLSFRGWSPYLTLYSAEGNRRVDGAERIKLNNSDLELLNEELSAVFDKSWTNFILAYRLYGPSTGQGSQGQGSQGGQGGQPQIVDASELTLDLSQQPKGTLAQVLDLIGKQVQFSANGQQVRVNSPFEDNPVAMALYLPQLMENCTVSDAATIPGRVNINQAPREILLGIPGITAEIVEEIINRRNVETDSADASRQYETWLLSEGIVTLDEMRQLTPFITAGGDVFRAQIVGYYQGGGPSSRAEVVFEATGATPRVLFWRDISHLGRGYALETLGVELTAPQ